MSVLPHPVATGALSNIEPGPVRRRSWAEWFGPVDLAFVLLLVVAAVVIQSKGQGDKFFYDEWTWIETRNSGLSAILDSYNQHMEIIPSAVYQLFFRIIGLDHYRWYRLLALVAHLSVVTAVYVFARRRIGALALAVAVPLALFGAGWEDILWGINFGFAASIALGVIALIWLEPERRVRFLRSARPLSERSASLTACALLVLGLLFTETTLVFAIAAAIELTWRDRGLRRFWVWLPTLVLYGLWFAFYYQSIAGRHDFGAIPMFDARLAAAASGGWFGSGITVGWVVLGLVVVVLVVRIARHRALTPRFAALFVAAVAYWTLVAYGRAALGDPNASRYIYAGGIIWLLVLIEGLSGLRVDWKGLVVFAIVGMIATDGGLKAFAPGEFELGTGSNLVAAELTALPLLKGRVAPTFVLDSTWAPQITPELYFPAVAKLGSTGADTPVQFAQASPNLQSYADQVLLRGGSLTVNRHPASTIAAATAPVVDFRQFGTLRRRGGCLRYVPGGPGSTLDLTVPPGGLVLHVQANAAPSRYPPTEIFLRRLATQFVRAPVVSTRAAATVEFTPRADSDPAPWRVRLSPWGTVTACGVAR